MVGRWNEPDTVGGGGMRLIASERGGGTCQAPARVEVGWLCSALMVLVKGGDRPGVRNLASRVKFNLDKA